MVRIAHGNDLDQELLVLSLVVGPSVVLGLTFLSYLAHYP